jgi:AraC family transcriptional regulator of adaptative response/methylated-DNA-[protein]-cysteine methyltransferase
MIAVAASKGICILEFTDRRMLETEFKQIEKYFKSPILPGKNEHFAELRQQLSEYFKGKRKEFDLPLVTPGTDFQKGVWKVLRGIPYGETISYKKEAILLGNPKAVQGCCKCKRHEPHFNCNPLPQSYR